jgi:two-component system sensor histidine kinase SenX3
LLSRTAAVLHTLFGYLLLASLVVGEWAEWIPSCFPLGAVGSSEPLDGRFVLTLLTVYGLLFALSHVLLTGLAQLLRLGERDLRHANEELQRLSAMRRDFLQILLHDLKSPLSAVAQHLYNVEAHLHDNLSDQIPGWIARCQLRIKELSSFLRDLQMLAILESDEIQKQVKSIDLKSFLEEIAAEYQDSAKIRDHTLTFDVPEDAPPVQGIERLLREAVANLITNAIKYTPPGGVIQVRATIQPDAVCIEVQDNGIGISEEDQKRLFQEMSMVRLKPHASAEITGRSGLGLSLVRRIVELHNGTVSVQSAPDRGSTFTIRLGR